MASVHYGRLMGPVGFSRTVAIKRLHNQFARDPEFVAMFLEEARLAARIRHPNVVPTLDVVALEHEAFLVMDYVPGESLAKLLRAARPTGEIPLDIVSAILCGVLHGLHAAHEATDERGAPLCIVHRDVSPQNVIVGIDGVPRVLDFGVAKAANRGITTRTGQMKGKLAYMAPEQLRSNAVDRRTDVYAAGIVLWETLTLKRLFAGDNEAMVITSALEQTIVAPSSERPGLPAALDAIVLRALERDPEKRFASAREMALELEACVPVASSTRMAGWLSGLVGVVLAERAKHVVEIESYSGSFRPSTAEAETPAEVSPENVPSQVSSLSVSSSATPRGAPRTKRVRLMLAALVVGVGAAAALVLANLHGGPPPVIPSALASVSLPSVTIPPPPPEPSTVASATPTLPTASSAPKDKPRLDRPRPAASAAVVAPSSAAPRASASASASAPPCTVTSFIDESGIKHFVKDCK